MGARGPQPKPPELKLLEGNRGHRPLQLDTLFRPEVGAPSAPQWLSREARKAWKALVPELVRYNLLATVDRQALAMLCQTIGRVEQLERSIGSRQALLVAEGGDPVEALIDRTPNGMRVQAVTYQLLNREQAKLHKLLENFGLRPDARARVTAGIRAQLQLFEVGTEPAGTTPAPEGFAQF
jgi:P27 family predicted phage terminase small subunit